MMQRVQTKKLDFFKNLLCSHELFQYSTGNVGRVVSRAIVNFQHDRARLMERASEVVKLEPFFWNYKVFCFVFKLFFFW